MDGLNNIPEAENRLPNWSYIVIAGGTVLLGVTGTLTGLFISKKRREAQAEQDAKEFNKEQLEIIKTTPRNDF